MELRIITKKVLLGMFPVFSNWPSLSESESSVSGTDQQEYRKVRIILKNLFHKIEENESIKKA